MDKKTVLVTGAQGNVGKLLATRLKALGHSVIQTARKPAEGVVGIDLLDETSALLQLIEKTKPSVVFHAAVMIRNADPALVYSSNVKMLLTVGSAIAQSSQVKDMTLVNLSSAAELGQIPDDIQYAKEDFLCDPVSVYGASKFAQTELALQFSERYGFRVVCARIFNVLGKAKSSGQPVQEWIQQIALIKKGAIAPILKTGNLNIFRDFLHDEAVVELLIRLGFAKGASGIVNVASGRAVLLRDVVELLQELSGVTFTVQNDPDLFRAHDIHRVVACTDKLESFVGKVEFDLKATLKRLWENASA